MKVTAQKTFLTAQMHINIELEETELNQIVITDSKFLRIRIESLLDI